MATSTFKFRAIRIFAASESAMRNTRMSYAVPVAGPDYEVVTRHRTREQAEATAQSTTRYGFVGILKSGRVGEIEGGPK